MSAKKLPTSMDGLTKTVRRRSSSRGVRVPVTIKKPGKPLDFNFYAAVPSAQRLAYTQRITRSRAAQPTKRHTTQLARIKHYGIRKTRHLSWSRLPLAIRFTISAILTVVLTIFLVIAIYNLTH